MTTPHVNQDSLPLDAMRMIEPLVSIADLSGVIRKLLRLDSDELDLLFSDSGALSLLLALLRQTCRKAFQDHDSTSQFALHVILNDIYKLSLRPPDGTSSAQGSMLVAAIKGMIERHMLAAEDGFIAPTEFEHIPPDATEFVKYLERLIEAHPAFNHPFYTQTLRNEADVAGLRVFFTQEASVDGSFSDFLALLLPGTGGGARMEISKNYWDEMGNGKPEEVHTDLFMRALRALNLEGQDLEQSASLGSFYCGNLSLALVLNRKLFPAALGYFAAMEYLVPHRFEHVLAAWQRNALPPDDIEYHRLHIEIDVIHSRGWLDNVIKPLVEAEPSKAKEIVRGVFYRLNSSARYLDALIPLVRDASRSS